MYKCTFCGRKFTYDYRHGVCPACDKTTVVREMIDEYSHKSKRGDKQSYILNIVSLSIPVFGFILYKHYKATMPYKASKICKWTETGIAIYLAILLLPFICMS